MVGGAPVRVPVLLRRCRLCGCSLFSTDYVGSGAGVMDKALCHHSSGNCASDDAYARAVVEELKDTLLKSSTASEGDEEVESSVPWPEGEPPLVFLAREGKSACALALLRAGVAEHCGGVDARGRCGATALHHAAARNDTTLVTTLIASGASASMPTQDDFHAGVPGGRTPLHAAACTGAAGAAAALASASPADLLVCDWEDRLPAELAWLAIDVENSHALALTLAEATMRAAADKESMHSRLESILEAEADDGEKQHARMLRKVELRERRRASLEVAHRSQLQSVHLLKAMWSAKRCADFLDATRRAAALHGWTTGRHRHHATTDVPLWRLPAAAAKGARAMVEANALPAIARAFGITRDRLSLREAFVAKYDGDCAKGGQRSLSSHKDGTLLAFTMLLSDARDFDGGGTSFAAPVKLHEWSRDQWTAADWSPGGDARGVTAEAVHCVRGDVGDMVVQCGQIRHGGAEVTRGCRYVLVGFVDELQLAPEAAAEEEEADEADEADGQPASARTQSPHASPAGAIAAASPCLSLDGGSSDVSPTPTPTVRFGGVTSDDGVPTATRSASVGDPSARSPGSALSKGGRSLRRTKTDLSIPGSRRLISFGAMDDPRSAVPERRGKFTLPGGRPAFAPGWDDNQPKIEDDEAELRAELAADAKGKA